MTAEEAVVTQLLDTPEVRAVVGTRVYQLMLPQKPTLPAIRVQLVDEPEMYHLRGPDNMTRARVQVDCYFAAVGDAYDLATNLAEHVNTALVYQPWNTTSPNRQVSGAFRILRRVMYEGEEFRLVRVFQDYHVWSAEN